MIQRVFYWVFFVLAFVLMIPLAQSQSLPQPTTKLIWHGHAAFEIITPRGKVLMIDPWLSNPMNPNKNAVASVKKLDYLFLTHGHFDHVGETIALAKATRSQLVTNPELAGNLVRLLGYPKELAGFSTVFNRGGQITIADGEVVVFMTPAVHSSGLESAPNLPIAYGGEASGFIIQIKNGPTIYHIAYGGEASGFIIQIKNGPTIYHSGDTAYFKDMEEIARFKLDVALINIGGHFGMEPEDAARAAQAVGARLVIPHHFKTFPILTQDPAPFFSLLDQKGIQHVLMNPGQTLEFVGKELKK